ncbi:hypothetical protein J6590_040929 [Homalodisca vitripennis]|nr:hypothetical protein J6590_040929 [Homalodisca vitripennis]
MTGENQLISWTSSVRGRKLSRTCQKENGSPIPDHSRHNGYCLNDSTILTSTGH